MADPLIGGPDTLGEYWRPLTDAEAVAAQGLILVASALIRGRVPDIDAKIEARTVEQAVVDYVVTEMIKSAVESGSRPTGTKSESETVGPFSRTITYDAASRIGMTDDLAAMLGADAATGVLGSTRLGVPGWVQDRACQELRHDLGRMPGWR